MLKHISQHDIQSKQPEPIPSPPKMSSHIPHQHKDPNKKYGGIAQILKPVSEIHTRSDIHYNKNNLPDIRINMLKSLRRIATEPNTQSVYERFC